MLKTPAYVVVEGVIGVGKTSMVKMLVQRIGGKAVLEEFEENPFLAEFYQDMNAYAFQTQLFFLLSRFKQQERLLELDLFAEYVLSDYLFAKDRIFACLTLDDHELTLYDEVHGALARRVALPDLVIYLQASTDVLMDRIRGRDREMERGMDRDYIHKLNEAYNYFFFHYTDTPLLVVNTDEVDFVSRRSDFDDLAAEILEGASGTRYYVPRRGGGGKSPPDDFGDQR